MFSITPLRFIAAVEGVAPCGSADNRGHSGHERMEFRRAINFRSHSVSLHAWSVSGGNASERELCATLVVKAIPDRAARPVLQCQALSRRTADGESFLVVFKSRADIEKEAKRALEVFQELWHGKYSSPYEHDSAYDTDAAESLAVGT